jgi:2-polyprenyl-3-methyl-5-hydroxy-6-metoxy-1,4-benzoquinol methylase
MLGDEELDRNVREAFDPATREWGRAELGCDPAWAVDYFVRFFQRPLSRWLPLSQSTAIECACGVGFNAISFVLSGGRSIVGYDLTEGRVRFANELAHRLGIADRARFELRDIHRLPHERADIAFTLQTLEHVPEPIAALRALADRARRAVVLSTPNRLFPKDGHDSGLLFAHWLPDELRKRYTAIRRARADQFCRFLDPFEIADTLREFELVTRAYNFSNLDEWLDQYPCFFPYGPGGGVFLPARKERLRWRAASAAFLALGDVARLLAPVIEGIYLRKP